MRFRITEMSFGEILSRAIQIFFARLPALFFIQMIVLSPTLVMQLMMPEVAISRFGHTFAALPMIVLGPIGTAATLRIVMQEYLDQPIGIGEAFLFGLGRFLPLLGTSILMGLGIMLGLFLCCIPGIYLAICWAFMSQVVVMENLSGMGALGRSRDLVFGFFWHVFGVLFVVGLAIGVANAAINIALPLFFPFAIWVPGPNRFFPQVQLMNYQNFVIVQLVSTPVSVLGQTFIAVVTSVLYFDLRNRKEQFNIEQIAAWSDQFRTWRDEPDVALPPSAEGGKAPETGVKASDHTGTSPETGVTERKPEDPSPPGQNVNPTP